MKKQYGCQTTILVLLIILSLNISLFSAPITYAEATVNVGVNDMFKSDDRSAEIWSCDDNSSSTWFGTSYSSAQSGIGNSKSIVTAYFETNVPEWFGEKIYWNINLTYKLGWECTATGESGTIINLKTISDQNANGILNFTDGLVYTLKSELNLSVYGAMDWAGSNCIWSQDFIFSSSENYGTASFSVDLSSELSENYYTSTSTRPNPWDGIWYYNSVSCEIGAKLSSVALSSGSFTTVPEPSFVALLFFGLPSFVLLRRKNR